MGRQVRMVPPNWQHPMMSDGSGRLQPMYDRLFADVHAEWLSEFDRVRRGELDAIERECYTKPGMIPLNEWLRDAGHPPDPAYHRPWRDDEATWVQLWETVSEGTPVSPAFATPAELVDYLVDGGDDWERERAAESRRERIRWTRKQAEDFMARGYSTMPLSVRLDLDSRAPPFQGYGPLQGFGDGDEYTPTAGPTKP